MGSCGQRFQRPLRRAQRGGAVDTEAAALFGQVEVALADRLTLTAGGRYRSESKSVAEYNGTVLEPYEGSIYDGPTRSFPRFSSKRRWTSFDPKVTLAFNASEVLMFYGTYASGFQSGGFNVGGRQPPFSPEELDDYEAGLKWELFDRRLQINLAGFYYDYQNLQVQRTINNQTQVDNAASSTVRGVEAELRARPADHIEVGLNVALLDAEFDQYLTSEAAYPALGVYSLAGNTLPQAPREAVTLDGAYTLALGNGALRLRGDVSFKSKIYFSQFNREQVAQGAYTLANADLTYTAAGDWFVSLYGRNLTNERYRVSASGGTALLGFAISGAFGPPRTVGVTLGRDF